MSWPEPQSPLEGHMRAGRFGAAGASPVRITYRRQAIVQITARKRSGDAVRTAVEQAVGVQLPVPGHSAGAGEVTTLWIAPQTWLVLRPWSAEADPARELAAKCEASAAVVDQSCGKAMLRLSGAKARDVLAKGCRVDLHSRVFGPGRVAVTPVAHINAIVHQIDATPTFDLIVPSTLARDFLEWLCASAAEFGYQMQT